MVPAYARVLLGKKPYIAPPGHGHRAGRARSAPRRAVGRAHATLSRGVRGAGDGAELPPAYLHLVAMPMHMQLFVVRNFPVKVLGLIHLRNTIRVLHPVEQRAPLRLTVHFDTMRLTDFGQEYDFTTRYEQNGAVVWEEVSTMFARGNTAPKEGSQASRHRTRECTRPAACRPRRSR